MKKPGRSLNQPWTASPVSKYKKNRSTNRPIWMTREISRAMGRKRPLWRKEAPADEHKEAEKKVRNLIRNAKRNFERKKLAKNNGNSKPFYSYLKNKTQCRSGIGPLTGKDDKPTTNSKEMASILNTYSSIVFSSDDQTAQPTAEQLAEETLDEIQFKVRET